MKRQFLPTLIICAFFSSTLFSQQLPIFTQYREMLGILNPAAPSSDYLKYGTEMTTGLSYRNQWAGVSNSPTTMLLHGTYVLETGSVNLLPGFQVIRDKVGKISTTAVYGRLGGIISDNPEEYGISLGIHAGFGQYSVDLSGVDPRSLGNSIGDAVLNQFYPDVGAGIFAYTDLGYNKVFGGLSVPQMFAPDLEFKSDNNTYKLKLQPHFYGVGGIFIETNNDAFLELSTWIKYVQNTPLHVDLNLRYQMDEHFWLGGGMSTSKTAHVEAGVVLGGQGYSTQYVKIGYGMDFSFSQLNPFYGTSHEINITVSIDRD